MGKQSDPYDLFIFAINAEQTRQKYLTRLNMFFQVIGIDQEKKLSIEERCKLFVRRAGSENGWLLNVILKFLQYQKNRVSHNEITGSTLRNYVKVLKLFCEMNDLLVPWKKLTGTRWSYLGKGSWIQLDWDLKRVYVIWILPGMSAIHDRITLEFQYQMMGPLSQTSLQVLAAVLTTSPEKYTLPSGTEGRYVRITVDGNTQNEWASITEISVLGGASSSGGGDGGGDGGNIVGTLLHKWQTSADTSTWSSYSSLGGL